MTAEELIEKFKATGQADEKGLLKLISLIAEDGLLDIYLDDLSGSDGIKLNREQAGEIVKILKGFGYESSREKTYTLLNETINVIQSGKELTDEMKSIEGCVRDAINRNHAGSIIDAGLYMQAYNAYTKWFSKENWTRYEICHAIVCLEHGTTMPGGTKMIIENRLKDL